MPEDTEFTQLGLVAVLGVFRSRIWGVPRRAADRHELLCGGRPRDKTHQTQDQTVWMPYKLGVRANSMIYVRTFRLHPCHQDSWVRSRDLVRTKAMRCGYEDLPLFNSFVHSLRGSFGVGTLGRYTDDIVRQGSDGGQTRVYMSRSEEGGCKGKE